MAISQHQAALVPGWSDDCGSGTGKWEAFSAVFGSINRCGLLPLVRNYISLLYLVFPIQYRALFTRLLLQTPFSCPKGKTQPNQRKTKLLLLLPPPLLSLARYVTHLLLSSARTLGLACVNSCDTAHRNATNGRTRNERTYNYTLRRVPTPVDPPVSASRSFALCLSLPLARTHTHTRNYVVTSRFHGRTPMPSPRSSPRRQELLAACPRSGPQLPAQGLRNKRIRRRRSDATFRASSPRDSSHTERR